MDLMNDHSAPLQLERRHRSIDSHSVSVNYNESMALNLSIYTKHANVKTPVDTKIYSLQYSFTIHNLRRIFRFPFLR